MVNDLDFRITVQSIFLYFPIIVIRKRNLKQQKTNKITKNYKKIITKNKEKQGKNKNQKTRETYVDLRNKQTNKLAALLPIPYATGQSCVQSVTLHGKFTLKTFLL